MRLFDYAYCGNFKEKLSYLATLSPEQWSIDGSDDLKLLENYIFHTFLKLQEENSIIETPTYAIFNTGLFDNFFEPIYCYFVLNKKQTTKKWYLQSFYRKFDISKLGINELPKKANYFTNPSDLVFDTTLDIVPQYDHIFGDTENLNRLPENLRNNCMKKQLFDGALETTKKMLSANYKIAIPQYYHQKIQLLVPLYLSGNNKPDIALCCEKNQDVYLANTCLTLDMAYNNARLIAKPESNWLIV